MSDFFVFWYCFEYNQAVSSHWFLVVVFFFKPQLPLRTLSSVRRETNNSEQLLESSKYFLSNFLGQPETESLSIYYKVQIPPWAVWLTGLERRPQAQVSQVPSMSGHTPALQVHLVGGGGACGRQLIHVSHMTILSLPFFPSLYTNRYPLRWGCKKEKRKVQILRPSITHTKSESVWREAAGWLWISVSK